MWPTEAGSLDPAAHAADLEAIQREMSRDVRTEKREATVQGEAAMLAVVGGDMPLNEQLVTDTAYEESDPQKAIALAMKLPKRDAR